MYTDEQLIEEGNRLIVEFGRFAANFELIESFYHGTFGRCLRFRVQTIEEEDYRILFHRTGLTCLNTNESFESFEQFFNTKSGAYRAAFSHALFERLNLIANDS